MKYQIGDKIIVLHSDEEGKVIEIINDKMVMIEVRGVRFPAYMDQIDFPYFKMFTQKKIVEKKKMFVDDIKKEKSATKNKIGEGVSLSFIPVFDKDVFDDEVVDKLKVYLINNNDESYHFKYDLLLGGEVNFNHTGVIEKLSDFYLHDIDFEEVSDSPNFSFEFSLSLPDKKKAPFYERALKLRGKQLFKKIEEIKETNLPSFSFELFTEYPDISVRETVDLSQLGNAGYRVYDASKLKDFIAPARSVIDLHIEKLVSSWKHLSNTEIMTLQINEFEKYYELAIAHKQASLIVIHGIGEGVLRDEIHERLRHKKEVKTFVNQYHHLYGYGATEILFSY